MVDLECFNTDSWTAGVIGLGYVGLPFAINATEHRLSCVGYDIDHARVRLLAGGTSDIVDVSDRDLAEALAGGLTLTSDPTALAECDAIFVCVPSPLGRHHEPDLSYIQAAADTAARHVKPGALVSLESTSYPGTTDEVLLARLRSQGFTLDEDVYVAFSPERINPGHGSPISEIAKVVGGASEVSGEIAAAAYRRLFDQVHLVSSTKVAEMTKLLENTYRSVNIALANEMAMLCRVLDIDIWEVIDAAATKPSGFTFLPRPWRRRSLHSPGPSIPDVES
jgi:UDP-N-acetyl-D-glucosamine dehydrogenase